MERSRENFMVKCLFEEIHGLNRFSEKEKNFISQLNASFFNDKDYKLSEKQLAWLEALWTR